MLSKCRSKRKKIKRLSKELKGLRKQLAAAPQRQLTLEDQIALNRPPVNLAEVYAKTLEFQAQKTWKLVDTDTEDGAVSGSIFSVLGSVFHSQTTPVSGLETD